MPWGFNSPNTFSRSFLLCFMYLDWKFAQKAQERRQVTRASDKHRNEGVCGGMMWFELILTLLVIDQHIKADIVLPWDKPKCVQLGKHTSWSQLFQKSKKCHRRQKHRGDGTSSAHQDQAGSQSSLCG